MRKEPLNHPSALTKVLQSPVIVGSNTPPNNEVWRTCDGERQRFTFHDSLLAIHLLASILSAGGSRWYYRIAAGGVESSFKVTPCH